MKQNLRQRTRDFKRSELAVAAFDLMVEHGYDALTVDDLAREVGVSRATFFRYLGSKDEVAVVAMVEQLSIFADALAASDGSQNIWRRLRDAFEPAVQNVERDPERVRARIRMVQRHPELADRLRRARFSQVDHLIGVLIEQGSEELVAEVAVTASVAVFDRCMAKWAKADGETLRALLDRAFACLGALTADHS